MHMNVSLISGVSVAQIGNWKKNLGMLNKIDHGPSSFPEGIRGEDQIITKLNRDKYIIELKFLIRSMSSPMIMVFSRDPTYR